MPNSLQGLAGGSFSFCNKENHGITNCFISGEDSKIVLSFE
jgi:hypothetical protein